jgi:CheY-like chemotaxis protein
LLKKKNTYLALDHGELMFDFFKRKDWPTMPFDEIKKRARLLVIDDEDFVYKDLFTRDGYVIDKWDDVNDLPKLEQNFYDIILLDVQGVGKKLSADQGLGILKHIRKTVPAQVVIAFSNADYSLKYQDFFNLADASLSKGADYVEFKQKVDQLLLQCFSLGFYVEKVTSVVGGRVDDLERLEKETRKAILQDKPKSLTAYLADKVNDPKTMELAAGIIKVAAKVAKEWIS